jgi:hypothetical protein
MKAYGKTRVHLNSFLTTALERMSGQFHAPVALAIKKTLYPTAGLDVSEKR